MSNESNHPKPKNVELGMQHCYNFATISILTLQQHDNVTSY